MSAGPDRAALATGPQAVTRVSDAPVADVGVHSAALHAGMLIADKYQLVSPLGEGGMGAVWVALNTVLNVRVALKVLRAEARSANRAAVADRMLQEARAASRFTHPAVVRVIDFGKLDDGDPYFVMELLEGESFGDVLEKRVQLPAIEAVQTLLPIAHALVAAHEKKVVHRDLKPDNIMLAKQEDGGLQPKIIDFGIAKWNDEASSRVTVAGTLMGSPAYMAPEQARGEDVDARSDIWAFCVMLYEAVTGLMPFHAPSHYALIRAIIDDRYLTALERGVLEPELSAIIDRGLEKDVDQRWQSMRDLGTALAAWLLEREVFEDITGASVETSWLRRRSSLLPDSLPPVRGRGSHSSITRRREAVTAPEAPGALILQGIVPPTPAPVEAPIVWTPSPRKSISALAVIAVSAGVTLACVALFVIYGRSAPEPAEVRVTEAPARVATATEAPVEPPVARPMAPVEEPSSEQTAEATPTATSTASARPSKRPGGHATPAKTSAAPVADPPKEPVVAPLPTLKRPEL